MEILVQNIIVALIVGAAACYAGRKYLPKGLRMRLFGRLRPKPDARMLRALLARLGVAPRRCVLVEDTLAHQRSARSIGMKTVWMRRYLRGAFHAAGALRKVGVHPCPKPAYVCARINRIHPLRSLWCIRDDV